MLIGRCTYSRVAYTRVYREEGRQEVHLPRVYLRCITGVYNRVYLRVYNRVYNRVYLRVWRTGYTSGCGELGIPQGVYTSLGGYNRVYTGVYASLGGVYQGVQVCICLPGWVYRVYRSEG